MDGEPWARLASDIRAGISPKASKSENGWKERPPSAGCRAPLIHPFICASAFLASRVCQALWWQQRDEEPDKPSPCPTGDTPTGMMARRWHETHEKALGRRSCSGWEGGAGMRAGVRPLGASVPHPSQGQWGSLPRGVGGAGTCSALPGAGQGL